MEIKVLLVDDEKEFTEHLAERLRLRDLTVDVAFNGDEAIQYLEKNPVHVVVMDQEMPGLSGLEALKKIKPIQPDVQVIMLTGHGTMETAVEGTEAGAVEYLIKPYDTVMLASRIKELCEKLNAG
jgi:DNA-binding NtrC family response regulator